MNAYPVLGIAAAVAGFASRTAPLTTGPRDNDGPSVPAAAPRRAATTPSTPSPSGGTTANPSESDVLRAFLLQCLDAARRRDGSAWSALQFEQLRAHDQEGAPLADLRMQAWANDFGRLEEAIRAGRVFALPSGGRTLIRVEAPGQQAKAVAFVTVNEGGFRLDEN